MRKLFSVDIDGDVVMQDDTLLLISELRAVCKDKKLGRKALKWIVLVCDYNSPLRQLLKADKEKDATQEVYGKADVPALKSPLIKAACERYRVLQYDVHIEQYVIYTEKIAEYNTFIANYPVTKQSATEISSLMLTVEKISQSREKIKDLIKRKEDESHISGGGETPFIEQFLSKVS